MHESFQIGEWLFTPALHTLCQGERQVVLRAKLVDLLLALVEDAGQVLTRDELLLRVWGTIVVTDDAVTRGISELRRLLGDDRHAPQYIETIRKGGYRLVASPVVRRPARAAGPTVERATPELAAPAGPTSEPASIRRRAVALIVAAGLVLAWLCLPAGRADAHEGPRVLAPARPVPFTVFPGRETDPAVSPDGRRVAFAWGGADDRQYDIYVKAPRGDAVVQITDDAASDTHPTWSPDGARIAFLRHEGGRTHVCAVAAAGGGVVLRLGGTAGYATGLDWSPDGAHLLFASTQGRAHGLRLGALPAAGGDPVWLSDPGALESDHSAVFAPDGARVAFVRTDTAGGVDRVCVMGRDGIGMRMMATGCRKLRGLAWARDDDSLVVGGEDHGQSRLYRLDLRSGALREIPLREERASHPSLSRDARTLVYEDAQPRDHLWEVQLHAKGKPRRMMATTHSEREGTYAPVGAAIAWVSDRSGGADLWLAETAGSAPRRLTRGEHDDVQLPRWSPDARHIAYQASAAGRTGLWLVDVAKGTHRCVLADLARARLCGWTADGEALWFASVRAGEWQLQRLPLAGGPAQPVLSGVTQAAESADGRWLYSSYAGRRGVWRRPLADVLVGGGAEAGECVVRDFVPRATWSWRLAGDHVLLLRMRGGQSEVLRRALDTRAEELLLRCPGRLHAPSLSLSADRSRLLVATVSEGESDLNLIEDFDLP